MSLAAPKAAEAAASSIDACVSLLPSPTKALSRNRAQPPPPPSARPPESYLPPTDSLRLSWERESNNDIDCCHILY